MQPGATTRVRVGDQVVDLRSGELRSKSATVQLQEKPLQVLLALLDRPGEVVLRDELRRRLWQDDTHVDFDNNLNAAVKKLRDALGDAADSPRYVETLPRRGYRLIAEVEPLDGAGKAGRPALRWRWIAVIGVSLAVLVAATVLRDRDAPRAPDEGRLRLVVLPFANLTGAEEDEYLAAGLTEELITHLGRVSPDRLGVIARLSAMTYAGTDKPVRQIGRELGAGYALEGGVRRSDDRIRVTAQLIRTGDETHVWAEDYEFDRADLLQIEAAVAEQVASALALRLLPEDREASARAGTSDTEAYDLYLQGRYYWNKFTSDGYYLAVSRFEQALERDPSYAAALAGLADAYNLLAFSGRMQSGEAFDLAADAARRAIELDADLAEAHNALGFARLYRDWDFEGARQSFERAIRLAPSYAMAHHWFAGVLAAVGEHAGAIESMHHALELNPVELSVISDLGWYYIYADRFEEADDVCRRALELSPGYSWAHSCRMQALYSRGDFAGALALALESRPGLAERITETDPRKAIEQIFRIDLDDTLARQAGGERAQPLQMARLHARMGQVDQALHWLERALEERDPWIVFTRVEPIFDPLHGDARFDEICREIGLPDQNGPSASQAAL